MPRVETDSLVPVEDHCQLCREMGLKKTTQTTLRGKYNHVSRVHESEQRLIERLMEAGEARTPFQCPACPLRYCFASGLCDHLETFPEHIKDNVTASVASQVPAMSWQDAPRLRSFIPLFYTRDAKDLHSKKPLQGNRWTCSTGKRTKAADPKPPMKGGKIGSGSASSGRAGTAENVAQLSGSPGTRAAEVELKRMGVTLARTGLMDGLLGRAAVENPYDLEKANGGEGEVPKDLDGLCDWIPAIARHFSAGNRWTKDLTKREKLDIFFAPNALNHEYHTKVLNKIPHP